MNCWSKSQHLCEVLAAHLGDGLHAVMHHLCRLLIAPAASLCKEQADELNLILPELIHHKKIIEPVHAFGFQKASHVQQHALEY